MLVLVSVLVGFQYALDGLACRFHRAHAHLSPSGNLSANYTIQTQFAYWDGFFHCLMGLEELTF